MSNIEGVGIFMYILLLLILNIEPHTQMFKYIRPEMEHNVVLLVSNEGKITFVL